MTQKYLDNAGLEYLVEKLKAYIAEHGKTYTAGEGISISEDGVISLSQTTGSTEGGSETPAPAFSFLWDLSIDAGCYIKFADTAGNEAYVWHPMGADETVVLDTAPGSLDEGDAFEYTLDTELLSFVPTAISVGGTGSLKNRVSGAEFECSNTDFMSHDSGALTAEIINPYTGNVTINITVRTGPSII